MNWARKSRLGVALTSLGGWGKSLGPIRIVRGTINVAASGLATNTATITPAVAANRTLVFKPTAGAYSNSGAFFTYVELSTDGTTVTATVESSSGDIDVPYELHEYSAFAFKSVERGIVTVTAGNLTGTDALTRAVTGRYSISSPGLIGDFDEGLLDLNTSTSIRLTITGVLGSDVDCTYQIVAFW